MADENEEMEEFSGEENEQNDAGTGDEITPVGGLYESWFPAFDSFVGPDRRSEISARSCGGGRGRSG